MRPALALALLAAPAWAQNGTGVDAQENVFGATNVNAVTGHGRLTVGVSAEGDVTVLSWPGPSLSDQLAYLSSNALDARDRPRFGAPEGAGIVLGLACDGQISWLREAPWTRTQGYAGDGANPQTVFTHPGWGLTVTVLDAVAPDADVLVRQVTAEATGEPPAECALLSYVNLSPLPPNARLPELPVVDWALDGRNDFAAVHDPGAGAVIHFHPDDQRIHDGIPALLGSPAVDFGPVGAALAEGPVDAAGAQALVAGLADAYRPGAWWVVTTDPPPEGHQVGFDSTDWCAQASALVDRVVALPETFPGFRSPLDPQALQLLKCRRTAAELVADRGFALGADPWQDLADGALEGAHAAAGEVASALRTPLVFTGGQAQAALILGAGADLQAARAAADRGRAGGVAAAADEALQAWLAERYVPGAPGSRAQSVARRALINLRVGTDAATGAIVASVARQPPYYLDWPRDGAFFNVMLDVAGVPGVVAQRAALYAGWQRAEPAQATPLLNPPPPVDPDTGEARAYPADAWEMNHYSDGAPGGVFRFEIDTTAFAVWAAVAHVGWADDPDAWLRAQWPTIERGAALLARWRDPATGLHAPAQEDDAAAYTQTLHGAITVFGALDLAARAARRLGNDAQADAWFARARELKAAMEASFRDPAQGDVFVMGESERLPLQASGQTAVGPTAWLVWPTPLYALDHPAVAAQLARDLALIEPALDLTAVGGLYYMKNTIALAVAGRGRLGPAVDQRVDDLPALLAAQATDTDHFGEVMVVDPAGAPQQRVSTPHLWEGALYYLTVAAVEDPGQLLRYEQALPPSEAQGQAPDAGPPVAPDAGPPAADAGPDSAPAPDGCACRAGQTPPGSGLWLLALGALRRRRR